MNHELFRFLFVQRRTLWYDIWDIGLQKELVWRNIGPKKMANISLSQDECDDNSTEKTTNDINQAMVIVTICMVTM